MRPLGVGILRPSGSSRKRSNKLWSSELDGQARLAVLPELVERRNDDIALGHARPEALVDVLDPLTGAASFGELVPRTESLRQLGKGFVVVAGLAHRVEGARHGDDVAVVAPAADVVALERRGRRQHDVGVARGGRPVRLVHDDRVGPRERASQPVEVLVVVERIAARPVHEADVGQPQRAAVVVERAAGVLEQVADLGDRDVGVDGIAALVEQRQRIRHRRRTDVGHRSVAVTEPAPRQPDLAEQAASAMPIHTGCSPCCVRCSPQLTVTSVRRSAMRRASSRIVDAAMPLIASAHSGSSAVRPPRRARRR